MNRAETLRAVEELYGARESENDESGEPGRFLLIEEGTEHYAGRRWYSTHETAAAAADYHRDQEYAADWSIEAIVDLDTRHLVDVEITARETHRTPLVFPEPDAETDAEFRARRDAAALDLLARIAREPEWNAGFMEVVAEIVAGTGRPVGDLLPTDDPDEIDIR